MNSSAQNEPMEIKTEIEEDQYYMDYHQPPPGYFDLNGNRGFYIPDYVPVRNIEFTFQSEIPPPPPPPPPKRAELMDLPVKFLQSVIKELDWNQRVSLREVCRSLCHLVEKFPPLQCQEISLNCAYHLTELSFDDETVVYQKAFNGLLVQWPNSYKHMRDEEEWRRALKHLRMVLKSPVAVSELRKVTIQIQDSLIDNHRKGLRETAECTLRSLKRPIKAKSLQLKVKNEKEVLAILPYFESRILEFIDIQHVETCLNSSIKLSEIVRLKQFRRAKDVDIKNAFATIKDLLYLYRVVLESQYFECCEVSFHNGIDLKQLRKAIEPLPDNFRVEFGDDYVIFRKL